MQMDYSLSKEDRMRLRRERILNQQSKGFTLPEVKSMAEPPRSKSEERVFRCDNHLAKVTRDSQTLVRNVRRAAAECEAERRSSLEESTKRRIERLEQEGRVGAEHFKDISNKWLDAFKTKVPSEMYEQMTEQQHACDAVIQEKDKLIADLKMEIETKGSKYDASIERQEDEVQITIERCREQVLLMSRCFDEDLNDIEEALIEEWTELFERQLNEWQEKLLAIDANNLDRVASTRLLFEKWEKELEDIRTEKAEEYRSIWIELEGDFERLEQTVQSTKVALQLNEEKLEYGCQVLRKRHEDQMKVKASHKRKMTRLTDDLAALKSKVTELELSNKDKIGRIEHDCERIQQKISNHEMKFGHIQQVDREKLDELWRLNDETVRKLVKELLDVDREIHERILKLQWCPPSLMLRTDRGKDRSTETIVGDLVPSAPIYTKPLSCASLFRVGILATRGRMIFRSRRSHRDGGEEVPFEVHQQILRTLATKAPFLTEPRLDLMISTLTTEEQLLVQLDAIFSALTIRTEAEVNSLVKYIYKNCDRTENDDRGFSCSSAVEAASSDVPPLEQYDEPTFLKVVNDFIDRRRQIRRAALNRTQKPNSGEVKDNLEDIDWEFRCSDYWSQFSNFFLVSKEKLWDALLDGLEKLRKCTSEHSNLVDSNRHLRAHNDELRYLLSSYLNSRKLQGHEHG